jgi:hypothetical protein
MLTATQIENATTAELEELWNRIEAELTRRELEQHKTSGREVVEVLHTPVGTIREELVRCGKARCKKCVDGPSHGPYWYRYYRKNGKLVSTYLGKIDSRDAAVDKAESIEG